MCSYSGLFGLFVSLNYHYVMKRSWKMRKKMAGFLMVLCCGALLAGGCAKKEIVKAEEPISSPVKAAVSKPSRPEPMEVAVKSQPVQEATAVTEASAKTSAEAAAEAALEKVYFDFDSYVLSGTARDILAKNAEYLLKNNPAVKVQIEGNCDERGSDEYNLALGEKRAKAALNYLITLGVPAARLSFISYGKEKPVDPGHDEAAWAKNRRAEFAVMR
jgi:peptidoglycan-associated lipoprotein